MRGKSGPSPSGTASPWPVSRCWSKAAGATKLISPSPSLLTLLDGPYTNTASAGRLLKCDRLLLVAGGIGITGVIPYVSLHPNFKLCWSVKQTAECLVKELGGALQRVEEKDVRVGRRLDVDSLFAEEADAGWTRVGVVVSGPGGLCDNVRAAVVVAARNSKVVFELEVDAYTW